MKTSIFIFLSLILSIFVYSKEKSEFRQSQYIISDLGSVYEGKITGIERFFPVTGNGLGEGIIYLKLDTYPDMDFEITSQKGVKWGLFKEIAPGLVLVSSDVCKGWTVRLTVNSKMVITKCRILSYGDDTE